MNHKTMFQALIDGEELINTFTGKVLKLNEDGYAVLISKNWHNFNPTEWVINKPEEKRLEKESVTKIKD